MKTCPYCDSIISVIGVKNCPNCGATLGSVVEPENTSHIQQKPKPEVKPQPPQQNHIAEKPQRSKAPRVFMVISFVIGSISLLMAVLMLVISLSLKDYKSSEYVKVDGKITHVESFFSDSMISYKTNLKTTYTYEISYTYDNTEYSTTVYEEKKYSEGDTVAVYVSKTNPTSAKINEPTDYTAARVFYLMLLLLSIFLFGSTFVFYLIAILLLVKMLGSRVRA